MYVLSIEEIVAWLFTYSISLLLPLLFTLIFILKWSNSTSNTSQNLPPSPPMLPIIGNLHQLGSIPQRSLKSLAQKYGSIMMLRLGSNPVLIISSSDGAEQVMKTHDLIFANRPKAAFAGRLLYNFKDIAFSPYGEYWRQVRSICVLQLLSNKRVQSYRSLREEEIEVMLEKIRELCASSSTIRIDKILVTLTNNIVSRVVAIRKRYLGEEGGSKFKEMFEELSMLLGVFNVGDYIPWLAWINHINGLEAKVKKVAKDFDEYLEKIVEEGIKRQEQIGSSEGGDEKQDHNFVDVLLQVQKTNAAGFAIGRDSIKAIITVKKIN